MSAPMAGDEDDEVAIRFDKSLRKARLAEAAHFDAFIDIRDAATLRLQVLKEELVPMVLARKKLADFVDLALMPGDPPRLWLDAISYVIMKPDPRTYQLMVENSVDREVLFQSNNRQEMINHIIDFLAHRLIAHERERASYNITSAEKPQKRQGIAILLVALLSGFTLGVLFLLLLGIWLGG